MQNLKLSVIVEPIVHHRGPVENSIIIITNNNNEAPWKIPLVFGKEIVKVSFMFVKDHHSGLLQHITLCDHDTILPRNMDNDALLNLTSSAVFLDRLKPTSS